MVFGIENPFAKKTEPGQKVEKKSPEELRFDALRQDASSRPLGSAEDTTSEAKSHPDELGISAKSMYEVYSNTGDVEKVAMLRLQETRIALDMLASASRVQESHGDLNDAWSCDKQKQTETVKPILSVLGITLPETLEETRSLMNKIVSFENWSKLSEYFKKRQAEEAEEYARQHEPGMLEEGRDE